MKRVALARGYGLALAAAMVSSLPTEALSPPAPTRRRAPEQDPKDAAEQLQAASGKRRRRAEKLARRLEREQREAAPEVPRG